MMKYDMVMPKMGESITEGTIIKWLKKIGDTVEKDEIILEISTDKVDSEIPTPVAGKISELISNEGETVEVGTVIAKIETKDTSASSLANTSTGSATDTETEKTEADEKVQPVVSKTETKNTKTEIQDNRFYSPVVLSIARNEGISMNELNTIPGTGINGRVSKKDILNYLKNREKPISAPKVNKVTESASVATPTIQSDGNGVVIESMNHIRKKIAEHMVHTVHTSPHVGLFTEVDMSNIVSIREKNKNSFQQKESFKLTYMPFISEVIVRVLKEFPYVNSSIDGDNILVKPFVNLGIAVATNQGLLVPVIKNADSLNLVGIARAINDLAYRARNKKLMPDDVSGGTFSISNFGVYGTTIGFPLINQPQLAILGIGAMQKRPVVVNDAIAIRPMMNISLTFDHRLIDGEMGAKFLQRTAQILTEYSPNTVI